MQNYKSIITIATIIATLIVRRRRADMVSRRRRRAAQNIFASIFSAMSVYLLLENAGLRYRGALTYGRRFNLAVLSDDDCRFKFRFDKMQIHSLVNSLQLNAVMWCDNGTRFEAVEGICIMLRRMTYPNRWGDLVSEFGRSAGELSRIFRYMHDDLMEKWGHLLYWDDRRLSPQVLQKFAAAVYAKGSPLKNVWGFIDGTVHGIARPGQNQRSFYNGHKRKHSIKARAICTPDGIIVHMWCANGRHADEWLLNKSKILDKLEDVAVDTRGRRLMIYGDLGYHRRGNVLTSGHRDKILDPQQQWFNSQMSTVRICIEWTFGFMCRIWAYTSYKPQQKLMLQPVATYFLLQALLTNLLICAQGASQTSMYFDCDPPTINEYLSHRRPANNRQRNIVSEDEEDE